jgi:hypothetical protein
MAEERFIKVSNGAIYRYASGLMKRRDAQVVNGQTAADYFRKMGVKNDITEKYPPSELTKGVPETPVKKTTRRVPRKPKAPKSDDNTPTVMVSDEAEPDALKELLGDGEDLLSGD